jgi:hypothetical protein
MSIRLFNPSGGFIDLNAGGDGTAANTFTLPAETGTLLTTASTFAGTGPAFSAYLGSTQAISGSTTTKVDFDTESFDTASCYDTENKRFTPNVAGYYQVNSWVYGNASGFQEVFIYKNGSLATNLSYSFPVAVQANGGSYVISMNGSTDYIEIYIFTTGTPTLLSGATNSYFQAYLARAA